MLAGQALTVSSAEGAASSVWLTSKRERAVRRESRLALRRFTLAQSAAKVRGKSTSDYSLDSALHSASCPTRHRLRRRHRHRRRSTSSATSWTCSSSTTSKPQSTTSNPDTASIPVSNLQVLPRFLLPPPRLTIATRAGLFRLGEGQSRSRSCQCRSREIRPDPTRFPQGHVRPSRFRNSG